MTRFRLSPDTHQFVLLVLAVSGVAAGVAIVFAIAVGGGASAHAAGLVLQACTEVPQLVGGVIALILLGLPIVVVGSAVLTAAYLHWRTRRAIRALRLSADGAGQRLSLSTRVPVDVVDRDELLALTHGLLRPRILVSTRTLRELAPDELAALLAHEAHHVLRRDPLRIFAAVVAARALFPFPLVRDFATHFAVATELAADRAAIAVAGRRSVAATLLRFLDTPRHATLPCFAPARSTPQRVAQLNDPSRFTYRSEADPRALRTTIAVVVLISSLPGILSLLPPML